MCSERPISKKIYAFISSSLIGLRQLWSISTYYYEYKSNVFTDISLIYFISCRHINKAVLSEQRFQQLLSSTGSNHDNSQSNVRRRLSSSFAKIDAETTTGQTGLARFDREESPGDIEIDSLQKSTDSVFHEQPVAEATNSSPSNTKASRINPLTSRVRSQSVVVGGEPLSLTNYPLGRLMSESVSPLTSRLMSRTASGIIKQKFIVCSFKIPSMAYKRREAI